MGKKSGRITRSEVFVEPHALDRYRVHHPAAEEDDLLNAWEAAEDVDSETALPMIGRRTQEIRAFYRIAPDFQGFFVLVRAEPGAERPYLFRTYLRFQQSQQDFARRFWGAPAPSLPHEEVAWWTAPAEEDDDDFDTEDSLSLEDEGFDDDDDDLW